MRPMINDTPQLSAAAALLLLRGREAVCLRDTAKELAAMQRQLTGDRLNIEVIRHDLRSLAKEMAANGFRLYVTDAPDLTDDIGLVLA